MAEAFPSNFDWVSARQECSIAVVFENLKADAVKNVETRNEIAKSWRANYEFRLAASDGYFAVIRTDVNAPPPIASKGVGFRLVDNGVSVIDGQQSEILRATLTLTNEGACKLRVNGVELDRWQVLRMALEGLFFL